MKVLKLSPVKFRVIILMRRGWELGRAVSCSMGRRMWWLQKNGLGKGGDTYDVRDFRTGYFLQDLKLIERLHPGIIEFPTEKWILTEKGKVIEIEQS